MSLRTCPCVPVSPGDLNEERVITDFQSVSNFSGRVRVRVSSVFHPWLFNHRGHKGRYVGARGAVNSLLYTSLGHVLYPPACGRVGLTGPGSVLTIPGYEKQRRAHSPPYPAATASDLPGGEVKMAAVGSHDLHGTTRAKASHAGWRQGRSSVRP